MDRRAIFAGRYGAMLRQMGVEADRYPLSWSDRDGEGDHLVCVETGGWTLRRVERGQVREETWFARSEPLLYRLASEIVAIEGARWQAEFGSPGEDPRRADFARRLELMGRISDAWRQQLAQELAQWLARHPYRDGAAAKPARRPWREAAGLAIVAALALGAAAAHWPLASLMARQAELTRTGERMEARVIDRRRVDGRFSDSYLLGYRFTAGGRAHEAREAVDWVRWRASREGGGIAILVDQRDPRRSMIAGNDRAGRMLAIYLAIDAMLAVAIILCLRGDPGRAAAGAGGPASPVRPARS